MLRRFFVILFLAGSAIGAIAQQNEQTLPLQDATEPGLIPSQTPAFTQSCHKKHREEVGLDVLINSSGYPAQYYFRTVHGNEADLIALRTVANDRFSPAKRGGAAIQVERTLVVSMELCVEKQKGSDGTRTELLTLAEAPDQRILRSADLGAGELQIQSPFPDSGTAYKIGGSISAPKPLSTPEAHYTDQARKAHIQGACWIRLIVDQHGAPENVQVVRSLGMGLDQEAVNAVQHYRFRPAMKDGRIAVPVLITVEVTFRLG